MSSVRPGQPGATRVCPHCKATVLESAAVCPGCKHHLKFNTGGLQLDGDEGYRALSVDGTIAHSETQEACEYCVVLDVRNERGESVLRQVIGVGALQPGEKRHLNFSVDMLPIKPAVAVQPKVQQPIKGPSQPASPYVLKPPGLGQPAPKPAVEPAPVTGQPASFSSASKPLTPLQPVPSKPEPKAAPSSRGLFRKS